MTDLSILIPARNEMFLAKTVEDILSNIKGDTEVIVVMDGDWANPGIPDDNRVTIIRYPKSIGQRAATNQAAKLSKAKYLMKCDAHCAFDKGFDIKMMKEMHDDWTMAPLMKNLHAFDWICPDGHRRYQGPSGPCKEKLPNGKECGKPTKRDILWLAKESPKSVSYCFDSTPHFQYFGEYSKRPEGQGDITETMSLQGSCFMLTRDKYWELNVCEEKFGSWGSQGIEVAVKTWLSGGKVMVNKKTWYAHMFRTQGGDFGFPYPISTKDQKKAQSYARNLFFNNNWPQQIHPLSWLIEKFWPVKGWTNEDLKNLRNNTFRFSDENKKGFNTAEVEPGNELSTSGIIYFAPKLKKEIIYYTDNQLKLKIARTVQNQLRKISTKMDIPIISSSLKPMPHFGNKNLSFPHLQKGYQTMFKQILEALEASNSDIIFFCEHDVMYHPSHFDFIPEKENVYYYNQNVWFLRTTDGHALHYDVNQLSGLCAYRKSLLTHFNERCKLIKKEGFSRKMGFEPMTHNRIKWKNKFKVETWNSDMPNIDIRHPGNLTGSRWKKSEFRNRKYTKGWIENDHEIPGWGSTKELIKIFN